MTSMIMVAVEATIIATAMPTIVGELGGFHLFSWVFSIYLLTQAEPGFCCPITMTHAALPALRHAPEVLAEWQPAGYELEDLLAFLPAQDIFVFHKRP